MCGFVALFNRDGRPVHTRVVESMRDLISHRGPDDAGTYVDGCVGLGHRRLSIVDLSGGHQPMSDSTGQVWIAYNGEVYNHLELRPALESAGYPFKTVCDTEVILAGYVLEGVSFFEKLNGIFAFAIWDGRTRELVLVRDRMGVKPLYVWRNAHTVAVASEAKSLLEHPAVGNEINIDAVPEYLAFRQIAGRATMLRDIETLAPGEIVVYSRSGERRQQYWDLPEPARSPDRNEARLVAELDELMADAVRLQLMSDVPLGTFNSGGVDSSLVTSYVASQRQGELNTFCVGLEDEALDERPYAKLVADQYQTRHRNLVVGPREFADCLPAVNWHLDEPANHPNTVAMYLLSRWTKEVATVVLTGEGCDEFFAGYPRYRAAQLLQRLGPVRPAVRLLAHLLPTPRTSRYEKLLGALRSTPHRAIREISRYVPDSELDELLAVPIRTYTEARDAPLNASGDLVAQVLEQDQRNYIQSIFNRLDKASMAFGVEARVPLLDHRIIEFAARVPTTLKLHGSETKYLVKKLAERRLPEPVVYRKKSGLAMPLATWFRDSEGLGRYLDMLVEPRSLERPWARRNGFVGLVERVRRGEPVRDELLWGLVNLEIWSREVEGQRRSLAA